MGKFFEVYQPVPGGFIGYLNGFPGANTQGATLEETRRNLREAVALILDVEVEQEVDGRWIAEATRLPGVLAYGATKDEATTRAVALALEQL